MIEFKDIIRKEKTDKYYLGKELVFELIPQYKIKYADDSWSTDFYNLTRAAENGRYTIMKQRNKTEYTLLEQPREAF